MSVALRCHSTCMYVCAVVVYQLEQIVNKYKTNANQLFNGIRTLNFPNKALMYKYIVFRSHTIEHACVVRTEFDIVFHIPHHADKHARNYHKLNTFIFFFFYFIFIYSAKAHEFVAKRRDEVQKIEVFFLSFQSILIISIFGFV